MAPLPSSLSRPLLLPLRPRRAPSRRRRRRRRVPREIPSPREGIRGRGPPPQLDRARLGPPWEEILTPEADFARKSLNEGVEVPLQSPEAVEAFKMLHPSYRRKKMEESGLSEEEYHAKQFAIKGEIPDPLETSLAGPVAVRMVPPRDWPSRDWQVDAAELEFMREAHKLQAERVDLDGEVSTGVDNMCLERYQVFLKQYREWVAANREKLEQESYKFDQDYYPGRRKRGKDYKDDMAFGLALGLLF